MRAAAAVISDGFGEALAASRLIRSASLYVGVLFVLLAGGGILAELGVLSWSERLDLAGGFPTTAAADAANRANLILIFGVVCCLMVVIDATAVGMTLLASRLNGRPLTLRSAIQRARQVFWRLLGANLVVGVAELIGSAVFRYAMGERPDGVNGVAFYTVEPMVGAVVSIPFVLTTAGIVIADDSVGSALRRSAGLARRSLPIALALGLFGFVFSFIGEFAIDQGAGILLRIADAIHLDVASGSLSFVLAAAAALAILSAFGSILFTVGAVVSSAQATAFLRFGMPTAGLDRVTPPEVPALAAEPVLVPATAPLPAPATPDPGTPEEAPAPPAFESEPSIASAEPALLPRDSSVTFAEPAAPPAAADAAREGDPPRQNEWELWAERREPPNPRGTRWISIPMRAIGAFLWLVALAAVVAGPPH